MTIRLTPNLRMARAGAFCGILAGFALIVLVPAGLDHAGMHLAKSWGLGSLAAPLCLLGALPGALIGMRVRP